MDAFTATPLCPSPIELELDQVAFDAPELIVIARARRRVVACPVCGHATKRIHSRYRRTVADLPWHGLRVRLELRVRRFFCDVPGCRRRIFTERLPRTVAPYARHTARATTALERIAAMLGGRAGARLAHALGLIDRPSPAFAHMLLRSDRPALPSAPRVVGIDDWAWKKGTRYGTIVVDLERHRVLELLPDREPDTVAAWLAAHPTIEFISRDRAGAYAEAALRGAPNAIQVADRFHLFRNLTEAAQRAVERHHGRIHDLTLEPRATHDEPMAEGASKRGGSVARPPGTPRLVDQRILVRRDRRRARYAEIVALRARSLSITEIHRRVGLSRATITRWLQVGAFPERQGTTRRRTTLTAHAEYLSDRWANGCHNATALWRALRDERGFRGGVSTVRDWIRAHLRSSGARLPSNEQVRTVRPTARRAGWLLTAPSQRLNGAEQQYVAAVCAASPALKRVHALALDFRHLFESRDTNSLTAWLNEAERSDLHALGVSLRRDRDAVLAAMLFPWSNGQVEGQVNRLKLLKRMMYGRANLPLLRHRMLCA
jgi:transposase